MKSLIAFVLTALVLAAPAARAALNVLACEPEWMALTQELAGDLAEVSTATTALQDPPGRCHHRRQQGDGHVRHEPVQPVDDAGR